MWRRSWRCSEILGSERVGLVFASKDTVERHRLHGTAVLVSVSTTAVAAVVVPLLEPFLTRTVLKGLTMPDLWFVVAGRSPCYTRRSSVRC